MGKVLFNVEEELLSYLELGCCLVKQITNFFPGASYPLNLPSPGLLESMHVNRRRQQKKLRAD